MDDDKINEGENQSPASIPPPVDPPPPPLFQTTPVDDPTDNAPPPPPVAPEPLAPEEIAPEVETAEQAQSAQAAPYEVPQAEVGGLPPPPHDNRKMFIFIGGGVILFLIIFVFIVSMILGRRNSTAEVITLNYWGLWEDKAIMDPLIKEYESKQENVKIQYQKMSPQDYRERVLARSKNNQGPDIFRFHNTWVPEMKDVLTTIPTDIMSNAEFEKTFYPIHQKDLKVGDSYTGIPLMIDGLVLLYNEGLARNVGINNPPVTWDDVVDYSTRISVKDQEGNIITSGIALGTASNIEHFSDIFGLFLLQNGGDITKLDQPEAAQALEAYRKFAEPPNNVWDEQMPNSISAFIQEKVAMIIVPSWEIMVIKSANPEISMRVLPIPLIPGAGSKPLSVATYWVEGVSRYSKNQLEAWKFVKFLSEKNTQTKLYELQSKTRLFGEVYSRVELGELLSTSEYLSAVVKQADNFVSIPTISRTYDNGLNDEIVEYIKNAINATIQGSVYSTALIPAKEGVDQVLNKFGANK